MKRLFNHFDSALSRCQVLLSGVSFEGLENYRGRALCLTDQSDVIQLPQTLKESWNWIRDHYKRIGLGHTENVIWDSSFEKANEFSDHDLSLFMFTEEVHSVRPDKRRLDAVGAANSKNGFIGMCAKFGVPTPRTICYDSKRYFYMPTSKFPLYLKADVSVSGLGVVRCTTQDDLVCNLERIKPSDGFQLQEEIDAVSFINLQYESVNGAPRQFATTEQILDGNSHNGNVFPSRFDAWSCVEPLARFLCDLGVKEYFGFDVAITKDGPLAIECNPRFNGSTYPTIIARKLGIPKWMATNIKVNANSFNGFSLGELEYNSSAKKGIVVVNWGAILNNKLGVLIAGADSEEQQNFLCRAQKI